MTTTTSALGAELLMLILAIAQSQSVSPSDQDKLDGLMKELLSQTEELESFYLSMLFEQLADNPKATALLENLLEQYAEYTKVDSKGVTTHGAILIAIPVVIEKSDYVKRLATSTTALEPLVSMIQDLELLNRQASLSLLPRFFLAEELAALPYAKVRKLTQSLTASFLEDGILRADPACFTENTPVPESPEMLSSGDFLGYLLGFAIAEEDQLRALFATDAAMEWMMSQGGRAQESYFERIEALHEEFDHVFSCMSGCLEVGRPLSFFQAQDAGAHIWRETTLRHLVQSVPGTVSTDDEPPQFVLELNVVTEAETQAPLHGEVSLIDAQGVVQGIAPWGFLDHESLEECIEALAALCEDEGWPLTAES